MSNQNTNDNEGDFTIINGVLYQYTGSDKVVVVPEGVTTIGGFSDCKCITHVVLPDSVIHIGIGAFSGCTNLISINIPESVTSIGHSAFCDCSSLTDISVSNKNLDDIVIENYAFRGCNGLADDKGFVEVGGILFDYVGKNSIISIPAEIKKIGLTVFADHKEIAEITLPESVQSIGAQAFYGCEGLQRIQLPDNVLEIGDYAFHGCTNLRYISLSDNIQSISKTAFSELSFDVRVPCWSPALTRAFNDSYILRIFTEDMKSVPLKYRDAAAFGVLTDNSDKTQLEEAKKYLTKNATNIVNKACQYPELLNLLCKYSIIPPDKVGIYMEEVNRDGLTESKIRLLEYISCLGMKTITEAESMEQHNKEQYFDRIVEREMNRGQTKGIRGLTFVISGRLSSVWGSQAEVKGYLEAYGAKLGKCVNNKTDYFVICERSLNSDKDIKAEELSVPVISEEEFNTIVCKRFSDEETIVVPDWVSSIADLAFSNCHKMKKVIFPSGINRIGEGAFQKCKSLRNIDIPESVHCIENGTFYGCSNLSTIVIPKNVSSIGDGAFYNCKKLISITISENTTDINKSAFYKCPNLTIHAPAGSYAEQYAKENNIPFVAE